MPKKTTRAPRAPREAAVERRAAPPVNLAELPIILRIDAVSRVYDKGVGTIRRELREGRFEGAQPFDTGRPLRWLRDDIIRNLERRSVYNAAAVGRRSRAH